MSAMRWTATIRMQACQPMMQTVTAAAQRVTVMTPMAPSTMKTLMETVSLAVMVIVLQAIQPSIPMLKSFAKMGKTMTAMVSSTKKSAAVEAVVLKTATMERMMTTMVSLIVKTQSALINLVAMKCVMMVWTMKEMV